ncbi:hypothetical protein [Indioceanicola profundi]|uniref:hypothetical protein n=1 Tax=Indioceanicola profundi TaxID=2220096 RepID=UPI000E6ACD55|nr:hypothetical protein [Indioceanicola profundi]
MKELRCIVFTDREVVTAILDRRRKLRDTLPEGDISAVDLVPSEGGLTARIRVTTGPELKIGEQELQAALVAFCMSRNVPLPVDADKAVHLIKGRATLMVTMNFQKGARLITATIAEGVGGAGG